MASENSLNKSMSSAIKHYSSLFFLPSFRKTLAALIVVCIGGISLSTAILSSSADGFFYGVFIGISAFMLAFLSDYLVTNVILRKDGIFVMRRTAALSLFCWVLWLAFIIPGAILGSFFGYLLWVKLCLLGFAVVTTLRAVVFLSTSNAGPGRGVLASIIHPLLCIVPIMVYWIIINRVIAGQVAIFIFVASFLSLASANLLVSVIDRLGRKSYGIPAISLFRAFMLNWVLGENAPIEQYFEKMGEDEDVEVSTLQFAAANSKAAIIVPLVHPGPFKNLGSSLLPSLMKHAFEKAFGGIACVPLGILGHELDLASQSQNQKIINHVIASVSHAVFSEKATPFVRVIEDSVTVSSQVFGDEALLSFSLAPKTTEDLPQELGRFVREAAKKLGLKDAIVINAHNSITDISESEAPLDLLQKVASDCLEKAVGSPQKTFEVGAATVYPETFSLKDGMGTGGITAIAVKVDDQKVAYLVIDGNNMISGLREKMISSLISIGYDAAEVFTTDTHAVNAVVLGRRGYHPVGEVMDHAQLLSYIKTVALTAMERLKPSTSGALTLTVKNVRVIGQARIETLSVLVDQALQKAKGIVVPLFGLEGLLLILLLAIF